MDKTAALIAFREYAEKYDVTNINITLKIAHTYRVADISEQIVTANVKLLDPSFAWLLGLLHDIGRFEQITRYGTFKDALSVDHAELGADILFREELIETFPTISDEQLQIAETVIRLHNKLSLPKNLDAITIRYANVLRDADKVDIFRVLTEPPYDDRNIEDLFIRPEVMQCVKKHKCVPRPDKIDTPFNALEALISQICMAFELVYPESKKIVIEQGYLRKLLEFLPSNDPNSGLVVAEIFECVKSSVKSISPYDKINNKSY